MGFCLFICVLSPQAAVKLTLRGLDPDSPPWSKLLENDAFPKPQVDLLTASPGEGPTEEECAALREGVAGKALTESVDLEGNTTLHWAVETGLG